jgi:hypothetical protein
LIGEVVEAAWVRYQARVAVGTIASAEWLSDPRNVQLVKEGTAFLYGTFSGDMSDVCPDCSGE